MARYSITGGIFKLALANATESVVYSSKQRRFISSRVKNSNVASEFLEFKKIAEYVGYRNEFIKCLIPTQLISDPSLPLGHAEVSVWEDGSESSGYFNFLSLPLDELKRLAKIKKERVAIAKVTKGAKIGTTTKQRL
jgi:hypothetical protein